MDASTVRAVLRNDSWSPEYVEITDLTDDEAAAVPDEWRTLAAMGEGAAAPAVAARWRELCPRMPRMADFLERNTLQVVLARIRSPYHLVREFQYGDQAQSDGSVEIALVYLVRDLSGRRPCIAWFGRVPHRGDPPPWAPVAEAVTGTLSTQFHDGFMRYSWDSGLLATPDIHTLSQRWIEFTDTEAQSIRVTSSEADTTDVPRDTWPDFTELYVLAEHTPAMAWAVDPAAPSGSGWGDGADTLHPIADLAQAIETMLGKRTGAMRHGQF